MTTDKDTEALIERLKHEAYAMYVAPSGDVIGETLHAHNWADKPHRVLYDAVKLIEEAVTALRAQQDQIKELETERDEAIARADRQKRAGYCDAFSLTDGEPIKCGWQHRAETAEAKLAESMEVVAWYGEQAHLARLIHGEGDKGRQALAEDGGQRATALLQEMEGGTDA